MSQFREGFTYAPVEDVKNALDILETARAESQIRRVLSSASDSVEGLLDRRFYPKLRTQTFNWYDELGATDLPWTVWLDEHEVVSVTSVTTGEGATVVPPGQYLLKPDDGPPYTRIELDTEGAAEFITRAAYQDSVAVAGTFGYWDEEELAGDLAANLLIGSTSLAVTDGSLIGVGDLITAGAERITVLGRSFADSTETIATDVPNTSTSTIAVSDGSAFHEGELLLVGGERMLIIDIAGNTLVVKRGWDGSTLELHATGAAVYVSRTLSVRRAALGTTAAAHTAGDPLTRHVVPSLVRDLTVAEAMAQLLQERTAYARTIGRGDDEKEVRGVGLADLRTRALKQYGRRKTKARAA